MTSDASISLPPHPYNGRPLVPSPVSRSMLLPARQPLHRHLRRFGVPRVANSRPLATKLQQTVRGTNSNPSRCKKHRRLRRFGVSEIAGSRNFPSRSFPSIVSRPVTDSHPRPELWSREVAENGPAPNGPAPSCLRPPQQETKNVTIADQERENGKVLRINDGG